MVRNTTDIPSSLLLVVVLGSTCSWAELNLICLPGGNPKLRMMPGIQLCCTPTSSGMITGWDPALLYTDLIRSDHTMANGKHLPPTPAAPLPCQVCWFPTTVLLTMVQHNTAVVMRPSDQPGESCICSNHHWFLGVMCLTVLGA